MILIKCSRKIFGGYNPIGWHDDLYRRKVLNNRRNYLFTTESFIFSFQNNEDIKNMKISRVINSSCAIYNSRNGVNFGGGDLSLENDYLSLSCSGNYENLNDDYENEYKVEEIEAFSVVKETSN